MNECRQKVIKESKKTIMRITYIVMLLFLTDISVLAREGVEVTAVPVLPVLNLLDNGSFESIEDKTHFSYWNEISQKGGRRVRVMDARGASPDTDNAVFGGRCVRIENVPSGKPQFMFQVIDGRKYSRPPAQDEVGAEVSLFGDDEAGAMDAGFANELSPTHVLSLRAKTNGKVRGKIELLNMPSKEIVVAKEFDNSEWLEIVIPFAAPEEGEALELRLGLADSEADGAVVWYDKVSMFPIDVTLEYRVDMPGLREVTVRNRKNGEVIETGPDFQGSVEVPSEGIYSVEARDKDGNELVSVYPDPIILYGSNVVANGGFEASDKKPVDWSSAGTIDGNVAREGTQSACITGKETLRQSIATESLLAGRKYAVSFWHRTDDKGKCTFGLCMYRKGKFVGYALDDWYPEGETRYRQYPPQSENWRFYRYEFVLADGVTLAPDFSMLKTHSDGRVWIDDVNLHYVNEEEENAVSLLDMISDGLRAFYRSFMVDRIYGMENRIDYYMFDLEELNGYKIINETEYRKLHAGALKLVGDWKAAAGELDAFAGDFWRKSTAVISGGNWAEAAALGEEYRNWEASWRQMEQDLMNPIRAELEKSRRDLADDYALLEKKRAERKEQLALEQQESAAEDYRKAMELVDGLDLEARRRGVLELGRLENLDAAPKLIELLDNEDYALRRNALYALAWMRSKDAVPKIMELVQTSDDPWTRRRAVQALGQIGDMRASDLLKKLVEDDDGTVRQNAIISMGWLRDKSAVPVLTNLIAQCRGGTPVTFEWLVRERSSEGMPTNAVSGEALPTLDGAMVGEEAPEGDVDMMDLLEEGANEQSVEKERDPAVESGQAESWRWRYVNALNNAAYTASLAVQSLGLIGDTSVEPLLADIADKHFWSMRGAALFALGQLGDERAVPVLEKYTEYNHPDFRRLSASYRWHATAALTVLESGKIDRTPGIMQPGFLKQKDRFYWLENHFHRAFGRWFSDKNRPHDNFEGAMRYMGASGANQILEWWRVPSPLSGVERYFRAAQRNGLTFMVAEGNDRGKMPINRAIRYFGQYSAFAGMWDEEGPGVFLDDMRERTGHLDAELLKYIRSRGNVDPEFRWKYREFFAKHALALEQNIVDGFREQREYMHMLRKSTALAHYTSICSSTFTPWPTIALWGRMAHNLDINGTEPSYNTASYENAMFAEMCRDGGDTCVGMEIYIWKVPKRFTRRWEIGMSLSMLHAQQFFIFFWGDIFKQRSLAGRGRPEAWELTGKTFEKIKKLEPYLVHNTRPKDFAIVYSGRTSSLLYRDDRTDKDRSQYYAQNLYTRNAIGIFQALAYRHTQCDVIWADTMTPEKIRDYKVLLLPDAKTLMPEEENALREWVRNGGTLIATGTTTMFDQYGLERSNYGLADVFGVDFRESTCTIPLENIDRGTGAAAPETGEFTFDGHAVEYNVSLGYDKVNPVKAEVMSKWVGSGDPAVTLNKFGQGHCMFLTAAYPGAMYHGGRTIYRWPLVKHFRKGIPDVLAALMRKGLDLAGGKQPLIVESCPEHVETYLRLQPQENRMLFQLLNYHEDEIPVSDVKARLRVPGKVKKVYYGADDQAIEFSQADGYVSFPVRDFDIHEAIVVEW